MKTQRFFQSLTRKASHWGQQYKALQFLYLSKLNIKAGEQIQAAPYSKATVGCVNGKRSPIVFAIAVISLTSVMGQKLYNQPQLKIHTVASETIRAPYTTEIEDTKKTELQRKAASRSFVPVLMLDSNINKQIKQNLQQLLDQGNEIRISAGAFPFFETSALSLASQSYLRSCTESEWQALQLTLDKYKSAILTQKQQRTNQGIYSAETFATLPQSSLVTDSSSSEAKPVDFSQNADFIQAVAELEAYRLTTSIQDLSALVTKITEVRQAYAQASNKLLQLLKNDSKTAYKTVSFLDLSDEEWAKTQIGIQQSAERILTQGVPPGLPSSILENAVTLQVQALVPPEAKQLAIRLLLNTIEPNLKKDEEQTQLQAEQAAAEVQPVMVKVQQGEVIVSKGDLITAWQFDALDHYQLIRREINWLGLIYLGGAISGAVVIFTLVERKINCRWRQSDRLLVLLLALSIPSLLTMGTPYTTWSGVGLLLGSFYGSTLGVTVLGLLVLLLPISVEVSIISLLAGAAGGILGSCMAHKLRSREELAILGVAIALTEGGIYLIIQLLLGGAFFGPGLYVILQEAGFFALSGLIWSIIALGLSPYLEKIFDLVTPIRLAELASPNRLLLKRLATETPGTFQHTLFVSTLAEAAAKQLGCNVELVRAGTLYHDIGKMHDPLAFIENQMGGPNKHDTEIKDPWKSAEVIKKHVSVGLEMARKHRLPTAIQAFIPEHQGTMQIAYFYHQAQQMAKQDPSLTVNKADFSYDGPTPQSRETGIVMLADSCEAALRSLKDTTYEQALSVVNNILRARWQDQQLVDSGLTREEMTEIAEIFVEVWQQFHHKRIAYPKVKVGNEKS